MKSSIFEFIRLKPLEKKVLDELKFAIIFSKRNNQRISGIPKFTYEKNLYIIAGCNRAEKTLNSEIDILNKTKFEKFKNYYHKRI